MRPIDWRRLLQDEGVPFIEKGANVSRGEIAIKCPMCGSADPSFHMGLNLDNGWWSCWRNRAGHSGKSPIRLLMALLRIPYWKARELAGLDADFVDPEGFDAVAARLLGRLKAEDLASPQARRFLRFPAGFEPISGRARAQRYRAYLESRRFDFLDDLVEAYDLRFAVTGDWAGRVILPYLIDGHLVTWTGRAIGKATVRYRDLAIDDCLVPVKATLFNYDAIAAGGRILILVEGPLDALKLDFYGFGVGVRAVALSTNSINDEQAFMLEEALGQFDQILLMMDNASPLGIIDSLKMKRQLGFIPGLRTTPVPFGLKDAGELSPRQAIQWTGQIATQEGTP